MTSEQVKKIMSNIYGGNTVNKWDAMELRKQVRSIHLGTFIHYPGYVNDLLDWLHNTSDKPKPVSNSNTCFPFIDFKGDG